MKRIFEKLLDLVGWTNYRFFQAVKNGDIDYVNKYIQSGGDVNIRMVEEIYDFDCDSWSCRTICPLDVAGCEDVRMLLSYNGGVSYVEWCYLNGKEE